MIEAVKEVLQQHPETWWPWVLALLVIYIVWMFWRLCP